MDGPVLPGAQLAVPGASALGLSSSDTPPFDDSFYDAVVAELYGNGGYTPDYLTTPNGSALIEETNRVLMDAVTKGVSSITEEPDPAFSAALAQNTFIFSGFKTHQELQEVNSLLHDKDGNLRPFDEFKRDVDKLGKEYNQNYLRAEYNHAVQSAQMAAKWQEFQKHKDFVNLQYRTANDERVRAEHAALHGTTLPVDDPFWTKYLPPLGWNCRCTVVEVLKDSYPESNSDEAVRAGDSATSLPSQKIFRFNPGKELKVFPPKHPYLPRESQCSGCKYRGERKLIDNGEGYNPERRWCQACNEINGNSFVNKCARDAALNNEGLRNRLLGKVGKCTDQNGISNSVHLNRYGFEESVKKMTTASPEVYLTKNELLKKWDKYIRFAEYITEQPNNMDHNSDNPNNRRNRWKRHCTHFSYYKLTIKGVDYYFNVIHNEDGNDYLWTITTSIPEY